MGTRDPNIGNIEASFMDVIGGALLADYGARRPEALPMLRALYAILSGANWADRSAMEKHCGAIARFEQDDRVTLELPEAGCRVTLSIHYGLGVIRVLKITDSDEVQGR
jgi:mRNA-degrading endonuclease HigB of HigAB toxin-antitoxin module